MKEGEGIKQKKIYIKHTDTNNNVVIVRGKKGGGRWR